jgi:hypothetical protein
VENSQKDFFISYNKADVQWGQWIAWQLEAAGYTVNIQIWDFRPGQDFGYGMHQAIIGAKRVMAILSDDYLNAEFAQSEWTAAFVQDPLGVKRTLIPVRVRPCTVPGLLTARIYIDLVGLGQPEARKLLLDGLLDRAKPDIEPTFPGSSSSADPTSQAGASVSPSHLSRPEPLFPKDLPPVTKAINIFTVYAKKDKPYLTEIEKQLTRLKKHGLIATWNSGEILPGYEIQREFDAHWNQSQIILLLMSADLMNESYEVIERAKERQRVGTARVIPIYVRPCLSDFDDKKFVVLPSDGKAVSSWSNRDEAYVDVANGISSVANKLLNSN